MSDIDVNQVRELIPEYAQQDIAIALEFASKIRMVDIQNDDQYLEAGRVYRSLMASIDKLTANRRDITAQWTEPTELVAGHYRAVVEALQNAREHFAVALGKYYGKLVKRADSAESKSITDAESRRDRLLKAAAKAEPGQMAEVEAYSQVGDVIDAVLPEGLLFGATYRARVENLDSAVAACMANHELRRYVTVDVAGLAELYTRRRADLRVDGIEFSEHYRPRRKGEM